MNDNIPAHGTGEGSGPPEALLNGGGSATDTRSEVGRSTRADLIRAGRTLFAQKGFDGASVRAITTLAGANLGSITYHFGTKRDLYGAVLDQQLRPLAGRIAVAARAGGKGLDRMLTVVEAYFEHLQEHPDLPRLLLQELTAGKEPPRQVMETLQEVMAALVGLHMEGTADGSIRDGQPILTALSVVSQPIYMTLVAPMLKRVGAIDLSDPVVRKTALDHVQDFVRAGLSPAGAST